MQDDDEDVNVTGAAFLWPIAVLLVILCVAVANLAAGAFK